jgi:hypothetical protein
MDREETSLFETQSRELIEAAKKMLEKKESFRSPADFMAAKRDANFAPLHKKWQATYDAKKDSLTDDEHATALQVRDILVELVKILESLSPPPPPTNANGGRRRKTARRKYSRRYCKKTPCRRMGFTQRASCRPYKNCYRSTRS